MPAPAATSAPIALPSSAAEAARYALLRRLAPSMRHHLVVNLQPIGMIYEVMERRLRAPEPNLAHVHDSAQKINGFARAAFDACLDVMDWLAPDDTAATTLQEGMRECTALLATSLSFRGYALRNQVPDLPGALRRSAVRSVVTAALLHATDHLVPSADLVITAQAEPGGVRLAIAAVTIEGDQGFTSEPTYRKLEWQDLEALAAEAGVALERDAAGITVRLPWLAA